MQERWETWLEIQQLCALANASVSKDQLERWRTRGLLPKVIQVGKGRGSGSETRYPIGTANQAIAIVELLAVKEKLSFVGWQLWMRGFDVSDKYWKAAIDVAISELTRTSAWVRLMELRSANDAETIYDRLIPADFRKTPFAKGLAKIPPEMRTLAFSFLGQIAKGEFESFAGLPNDDPAVNREAIFKLIGQPANSNAEEIIQKILYQIDLELQLKAVSGAFRKLRKHPASVFAKLTPQVRAELITVLALPDQLGVMFPAIRKGSISKFAIAIATSHKVQSYAIVLWSVFREMGTIQSNDDIMELAAISNSNTVN